MALSSPSIVPLRLPTDSKFVITEETKIEIFNNNKNSSFYYTVNGEIPNPYKRGDSLFFSKPFSLKPGKTTVKAIAVEGDRFSGVTTKTFNVERSPNKENKKKTTVKSKEPETYEADRLIMNALKGRNAFEEIKKNKDRIYDLKYGDKKPPFANSEDVRKDQFTQIGEDTIANEYMETNYVDGKEITNLIKCSDCMYPRKFNDGAAFCLNCGARVKTFVQVSRQPDFTKMAHCLSCKSFVPQNLSCCIVCDEPLVRNFSKPPPIESGNGKICLNCGQNNPEDEKYCMECNYDLNKGFVGAHHIQASSTDALKSSKLFDKIKICPKCTRTCMGDSRFCDWCGHNLPTCDESLCCTYCGCANIGTASFCAVCGYMLCPPQISIPWKRLEPQVKPETSLKEIMVQVPKASIGTQTVGLYYPSQKELEQAETKSRGPPSCVSSKRPILSAFSPGKGFWRQQLDHIFGLFRHFCQQDKAIREDISYAQIGKLLEAKVGEGVNDELILTIKFATKCGVYNKYLSNVDFDSLLTDDDFESMISYQTTIFEETPKVPRPPLPKKETKTPKKPVLSLNSQLLREISRVGKDPSQILRLLDEGASPSCKTQEGVPALFLCIRKQKPAFIKLLVDAGAKINKKCPPIGNTALHYAVYGGDEKINMLEELLTNGGDPKIKNTNGDTAYDLAIKHNFLKVAERLLLVEEQQAAKGEIEKYLN